jgi:hypothetical protein
MESDLARACTQTLTSCISGLVDRQLATSILAAGSGGRYQSADGAARGSLVQRRSDTAGSQRSGSPGQRRQYLERRVAEDAQHAAAREMVGIEPLERSAHGLNGVGLLNA